MDVPFLDSQSQLCRLFFRLTVWNQVKILCPRCKQPGFSCWQHSGPSTALNAERLLHSDLLKLLSSQPMAHWIPVRRIPKMQLINVGASWKNRWLQGTLGTVQTCTSKVRNLHSKTAQNWFWRLHPVFPRSHYIQLQLFIRDLFE